MKSSSCDVVVRCIRAVYGRPGVLVTWSQEPVGVPVPYGSVRMTHQTRSVVRAVRNPQAAYMRPEKARTRPI